MVTVNKGETMCLMFQGGSVKTRTCFRDIFPWWVFAVLHLFKQCCDVDSGRTFNAKERCHPRPVSGCSLRTPRLKVPIWSRKVGDLLECFTALPFSTVYNIFLCLHIFSVHITHQNKKRNYENLDQLSYDNKRGPKVYLHGQCTPPTNSPNVATRKKIFPATSRPRIAPPTLSLSW